MYVKKKMCCVCLDTYTYSKCMYVCVCASVYDL